MKDRAQDSFAEVYSQNLSPVYGFVAYRVSSTAVAEDITQLVFERAWRAWSRYDPDRAAVKTWLLAIAKNVLVDHFRRRGEALIGEQAIIDAVDRQLLPETSDLSDELTEALGSLTAREQTVLALRFGADLSGREIGELLDLSVDNVHQIMSRSLRRLRELLEGLQERS